MRIGNRAGRRVIPFPKSRRVIVDIGRVAANRSAVRGIVEADLSDVTEPLAARGYSLTAYLIATLARAVAEHPEIHAMRDWRGRLVLFDDVDVAVSVEVTLEGRSFPLTHVIRGAQRRSLAEIAVELNDVKEAPHVSPTLEHPFAVRGYLAMPGPLRRAALRLLYRMPDRQRAIMGTVGFSSVGMVGIGGGWGFGFPVHPMDLLVGGISEHTELGAGGASVTRRRVALTLSFDHDVVDGAPATRFVSEFRQMVESGTVIDEG